MEATQMQDACVMKNADEQEGVDRISNLPDGIIHHLLNFIPLKSAIQMSILSKRWRYLWISVPDLVFDHKQFPIPKSGKRKRGPFKNDSFMDFVDAVLHHRDNLNVRKFSLAYDKHCNPLRVDGWISYAVRHKVQELELDMSSHPVQLPHCLFTCESLISLKLVSQQHISATPPSINFSFPKLRTLDLECVNLCKKTKLCFDCPALESLKVNRCFSGHVRYININAPELKRLSIVHCHHLYNCGIIVSSPKLQSLEFINGFSQGIYLKAPSSVEAVLDFNFSDTLFRRDPDRYDPSGPTCKKVRKFLSGFQRARSLSMSDCCVEFFSKYLQLICPFVNLKYLKVAMNLSLNLYEVLACLLANSPNLEKLVINGFEEGDLESQQFPCEYSVDRLEEVEIRGFQEGKRQFEFLKLLLSKAQALQRLTIVTSEKKELYDLERRIKIGNKLISFQRASPSVLFLLF